MIKINVNLHDIYGDVFIHEVMRSLNKPLQSFSKSHLSTKKNKRRFKKINKYRLYVHFNILLLHKVINILRAYTYLQKDPISII